MAPMFRDDIDSDTAADGTVTLTPVRRWSQPSWTARQIKLLFTPEEWSAARAVAVDVYEDLTLISDPIDSDPIDSDSVAAQIRQLIGIAVTAQRFTEITGLTP